MATLDAVAETPFETWVHRYEPNLGSSPSANAIAVDRNGYVAVAGFTYSSGDQIYYLARHDPFTGNRLWLRTYDFGVGSNVANDVAFDAAGNVYVTGESQSADNYDYFTRKYDKDGNIEWSVRYDGVQGEDRALFIAVSGSSVIVTGSSTIGAVSGQDIYTVRYSTSNGAILSSIRYTSDSTRSDYPTGLAIDSTGKVIVCGVANVASGDSDFYVAKYDMSAPAATVLWERFVGSAGRFDEAHDVAVDSADNVIVTGLFRKGDNSHGFYTRKFESDGDEKWSQSYVGVDGDTYEGARSVAVDADGNVFVTGVVAVDNFNTTFYTAKSFAGTGDIDWSVTGPLVENERVGVNDSYPVRISVDPAGNPIIAGSPGIVGQSADYYVAKYSSRNEGALLWEKAYKGAFPNEGTDRIADMAVDAFGNIATTGDSLREAGNYFEILTIKLGSTAIATGDPISGFGIPEEATITQVFPPATADTGAIAARVTLAAGRKKFGAIVSVGGGDGLTVPAVQGNPTPGVSGGSYKSFTDPVMAPNGRIAFTGKISGVSGSEATGVWTNAFHPAGALELALQQGNQVPGMGGGITLQSVSSISLRNNQLLALIKVAGKSAGVTKANATVLYGLTDIGVGVPLLRTDDEVVLETVPARIKSITVFTPPKGSVGHGRYHGSTSAVAKVTLDDKRTAIVAVATNGADLVLTGTEKDASSMVPSANWQTFSLPAVDTDGFRFAVQGTLIVGEGEVSKADDSIIGYSFNGGNFVKVARENDDAAGITGAKYADFQDPLVNENGRVAFVGTAKGQGVSGKNKTGLWFGFPAAVGLIARTGHPDFPATDGAGADLEAGWSSFKSLALPGGPSSGPIFLATIAGPGINGKNSLGLWAVDSGGLVRKLIRNGDQLGNLTVKKFVVLQPSPGSIGATRSFSAGGSVAVLVTFSDKSTGVLNIGIP